VTKGSTSQKDPDTEKLRQGHIILYVVVDPGIEIHVATVLHILWYVVQMWYMATGIPHPWNSTVTNAVFELHYRQSTHVLVDHWIVIASLADALSNATRNRARRPITPSRYCTLSTCTCHTISTDWLLLKSKETRLEQQDDASDSEFSPRKLIHFHSLIPKEHAEFSHSSWKRECWTKVWRIDELHVWLWAFENQLSQ